MNVAPGSHCPPTDRWIGLAALPRNLPQGALVVVDRRVARAHPRLLPLLERTRPRAIVSLAGGEGAKTLAALEKLLARGLSIPRKGGAVVAVGGGTIGDLCTVAAHLLKRGVDLVQVPTTLLAAVDSSVGGKGALHAGSNGRVLKNALGVFHYPRRSWLVAELFESLTPAQRREGAIEAWKMAVCLDRTTWSAWQRRAPGLRSLVERARVLKASVCREDPYEQRGGREVLNFGHTFGHVLESLTRFRLPHGDAVGLGMLCALDVGVALRLTPPAVARDVERALRDKAGVLDRTALRRALRKSTLAQVAALLAGDKKVGANGELRMVLLEAPGRWQVQPVPPAVWRAQVARWRGDRA